ncbi:MAG TPA: hypothetical protein VLA64_07805, partial [Azonexus sp.]|nr:hypothetical protein [Azonexus sp.]
RHCGRFWSQDDQHQELLRLLERLCDLPNTGIETEEFADRFIRLHNLWFQHFDTEEAEMRKMSMDCDLIESHAAEHSKPSELFVQVNFDCMNRLDLNAKDIYSRLRERIVDGHHCSSVRWHMRLDKPN